MFDALLVANRGEIAIRVIRACRELGVRAVTVYSEVDRDAPHVRAADEAYLLGPTPAARSYLHVERILEVAEQATVGAVHPGYGFLSENADFADAVREAGLAFVGPPAGAIRRMSDKLSARSVAEDAEVPVVPGTDEPTDDPARARQFGEEHGYPVAVKAMFGGGGRGLKVVRGPDEMTEALEAARREAEASFGRGECYLEKYLERPRHVEVQILGDLDGTVVHLGERDCSLQRRHQKLVEEAPAPGVDPDLRERLGAAAVRIAEAMGYHNAGTCEFLLAGDAFYFLEMNTRLQVEHGVTELVTGVDLVHEQLRIAAEDGMSVAQSDVELRGHAIECRLNAEDPGRGFVPCPGLVTDFWPPLGPFVRLDSVAEPGYEIPGAYDSMFAKLLVWAPDRDQARQRMLRALDETVVEGVPSTIPFHRLAMTHEQFVAAKHSTVSVEHEWDLSTLEPAAAPAPGGEEQRPSRELTVEVEGRRFRVRVFGELGTAPTGKDGPRGGARRERRSAAATEGGGTAVTDDLLAPMQGTVVKYAVEAGDPVAAGDLVVVLEAMKMENTITAHRDGVVTALNYEPGAVVEAGAVLARIESGGVDPGPAS